MATKTEIQTLLTAARRGDFAALCAAADWWQEHGRAAQVREWEALLSSTRYHAERRRARLAPIEAVSRSFRQFARHIARLEKSRVMAIPKPWPDRHRQWCRDMAHPLLKYVRAQLAREQAGE